MIHKKTFYFLRCYHEGCGVWNYTDRRIKTKKCWKCNKTFKFANSSKFSKECTTKEAIAIMKHLKKKELEEKVPDSFQTLSLKNSE